MKKCKKCNYYCKNYYKFCVKCGNEFPDQPKEKIIKLESKVESIYNYKLPSDLFTEKVTMDNSEYNNYIEKISKKILLFDKNIKIDNINSNPILIRFIISFNNICNIEKFKNKKDELMLLLCTDIVEINTLKYDVSRIELMINNPFKCNISIASFLKKTNYSKKSIFLGVGDDNSDIIINLNDNSSIVVIDKNDIITHKFLNTILASLLLKNTPNDLEIIIIDTKKIEFSDYNNLPHLKTPIIITKQNIFIGLEKIYEESLRRFNILYDNDCPNIKQYNKLEKNKIKEMVVIINDIDIILYDSSKEQKENIKFIISNSKDIGVYFICSANCVNNKDFIDTILSISSSIISFDSIAIPYNKCKQSNIKGSSYLYDKNSHNNIRFAPYFLSENQTKDLIDFWIMQSSFDSNSKLDTKHSKVSIHRGDIDNDDPLYNDVVEFVITSGKASTSLLQKRFKIGYNRAARLIDLLEERGIVGPR